MLREVWVGSRQRFFRCGYLSDAAGAISIPRPVGNGGLPFKTTGGADPPHIFAAVGGVVLGGEVFVLAEVPLFYQVWMGGTQVVDSLRRSISCADRAASTAGPAGNRGLPLISALCALPPQAFVGAVRDIFRFQAAVFRGMPLCSQIGAMLCQGAISGHQLFPERGGFPRHCIAGTPGSLNSVPYLTAPSPAAFVAGPDDHLVTAAGKIFRTYAGVVQWVPIQHQIRKFRQGSLFMVGHSITRNDRNRNRYLFGSRNILSAILVAVQSACLREIRFDWRRGRAGGHRIQIPLGAVRLEAPALLTMARYTVPPNGR